MRDAREMLNDREESIKAAFQCFQKVRVGHCTKIQVQRMHMVARSIESTLLSALMLECMVCGTCHGSREIHKAMRPMLMGLSGVWGATDWWISILCLSRRPLTAQSRVGVDRRALFTFLVSEPLIIMNGVGSSHPSVIRGAFGR